MRSMGVVIPLCALLRMRGGKETTPTRIQLLPDSVYNA
jgi:hypothetical protein